MAEEDMGEKIPLTLYYMPVTRFYYPARKRSAKPWLLIWPMLDLMSSLNWLATGPLTWIYAVRVTWMVCTCSVGAVTMVTPITS